MSANKHSFTKMLGLMFILFLGVGIIFIYFYPFKFSNNEIPSDAELAWEGEITDKSWTVDVDHEVYYYQINASINMKIEMRVYWEKFNIGDYVYCFLIDADAMQVISDNKLTY